MALSYSKTKGRKSHQASPCPVMFCGFLLLSRPAFSQFCFSWSVSITSFLVPWEHVFLFARSFSEAQRLECSCESSAGAALSVNCLGLSAGARQVRWGDSKAHAESD